MLSLQGFSENKEPHTRFSLRINIHERSFLEDLGIRIGVKRSTQFY